MGGSLAPAGGPVFTGATDLGAEGTAQELADVVRYLTKYYGKLNVNTATSQRIQEFLGFRRKRHRLLWLGGTQWRPQRVRTIADGCR